MSIPSRPSRQKGPLPAWLLPNHPKGPLPQLPTLRLVVLLPWTFHHHQIMKWLLHARLTDRLLLSPFPTCRSPILVWTDDRCLVSPLSSAP